MLGQDETWASLVQVTLAQFEAASQRGGSRGAASVLGREAGSRHDCNFSRPSPTGRQVRVAYLKIVIFDKLANNAPARGLTCTEAELRQGVPAGDEAILSCPCCSI